MCFPAGETEYYIYAGTLHPGAQSILHSSSKRAFNSTTAVNLLAILAALHKAPIMREYFPDGKKVCLIDDTLDHGGY